MTGNGGKRSARRHLAGCLWLSQTAYGALWTPKLSGDLLPLLPPPTERLHAARGERTAHGRSPDGQALRSPAKRTAHLIACYRHDERMPHNNGKDTAAAAAKAATLRRQNKCLEQAVGRDACRPSIPSGWAGNRQAKNIHQEAIQAGLA